MKFIFGPVKSKRLGNSLGVDIVPLGTCTFDCIYCQVQKTRFKTITRKSFFEIDQIKEEIDEVLKENNNLDFITFSGSGEPTLNKDLGTIIAIIKEKTDTPVAVITNGSLLYLDEVREDLKDADMIMPSLDVPNEELFKRVNRPHIDLDLKKVIRGIDALRKSVNGKIYIEIMLLKDINDNKFCIDELSKILSKLEFDQLFLNTVVRPPPDSNLSKPLSLKELENIAKSFEFLKVPIDLADPEIIQKRVMFANRI
ncbi:radical SAM protein [bacterium]|nr:radical SAM protein [bacterium]